MRLERPPFYFYFLVIAAAGALLARRVTRHEDPRETPTATPLAATTTPWHAATTPESAPTPEPSETTPSPTPPFIATGIEIAEDVSVKLRMRAIHARTSASQSVDPALADLEAYLRLYPDRAMRSIADETVAFGKDGRARLDVASHSLDVFLVEDDGTEIRLRLLLHRDGERRFDVTVKTQEHKVFFLAGPRLDDGVLLFALEWSRDDE